MSAFRRHSIFTSLAGTEAHMRLCQKYWKKPLPIVKIEAFEHLKIDDDVRCVLPLLRWIDELLIRKEYIELAQYVRSESSEEGHDCRTFLTGHPGVGETYTCRPMIIIMASDPDSLSNSSREEPFHAVPIPILPLNWPARILRNYRQPRPLL